MMKKIKERKKGNAFNKSNDDDEKKNNIIKNKNKYKSKIK